MIEDDHRRALGIQGLGGRKGRDLSYLEIIVAPANRKRVNLPISRGDEKRPRSRCLDGGQLRLHRLPKRRTRRLVPAGSKLRVETNQLPELTAFKFADA